jgi:hypothetical protein
VATTNPLNKTPKHEEQKSSERSSSTHPLLHELRVANAITENGAQLLIIPAGVLQNPALPYHGIKKQQTRTSSQL